MYTAVYVPTEFNINILLPSFNRNSTSKFKELDKKLNSNQKPYQYSCMAAVPGL